MTKTKIENLYRDAVARGATDVATFLAGYGAGLEDASNDKRVPPEKAAVSKKTAHRRKRGSIGEMLLKKLPRAAEGALTLNQLTRRVRAKGPVSVNGPLKKLVKTRVAQVVGAGGRGDPFRYWSATNGAVQ